MTNFNKWHSPKNANSYRPLSSGEIAQLASQGNSSSDWSLIRVDSGGFDAGKVHRCSFDGGVEIGALRGDWASHPSCGLGSGMPLKVGLYGSHFGGASIGDNAAVHNLLYCGSLSIGDGAVIANVSEITGGKGTAYGMSVDEDNQLAIDIINENGGRTVLPCPGMTCTDAFIWAKFRGDAELAARFAEISYQSARILRPWRAIIGNKVVILNAKAVRNTLIGPGAFIDGAELISNSTVLSDANEKTFIGAAVQIRNSIIGYGNSIDSAAQLKSVMTGTAVSLSMSARVTHSVIGDNSHIACCEIAHSLIMPSHGQHHNSSFLIAAAVGGQSNIASGATVGSNHNSRVNDGEIWANRGFWPGLCASLKHNSRFASFTMIAKGDYPAELDVKLPFSLVAMDGKTGSAVILPAYWFTHNMYAAMRCAQKFVKRDKRVHRDQYIEHDILAPDTVEEMFEALKLLERWVGKAAFVNRGVPLAGVGDSELEREGRTLLAASPSWCSALDVKAENIERGRPETPLKHAVAAYNIYKLMIRHYCAKNILPYMRENGINTYNDLVAAAGQLPDCGEKWLNCGSMVISETALAKIIDTIKNTETGAKNAGNNKPAAPSAAKEINTWNDVHALFDEWASSYKTEKVRHALQALARLDGGGISAEKLSDNVFAAFLGAVPGNCSTIAGLTQTSRLKDFTDSFRRMVYSSQKEMDAVLGPADDAVTERTAAEMEELAALANSFL